MEPTISVLNSAHERDSFRLCTCLFATIIASHVTIDWSDDCMTGRFSFAYWVFFSTTEFTLAGWLRLSFRSCRRLPFEGEGVFKTRIRTKKEKKKKRKWLWINGVDDERVTPRWAPSLLSLVFCLMFPCLTHSTLIYTIPHVLVSPPSFHLFNTCRTPPYSLRTLLFVPLRSQRLGLLSPLLSPFHVH